MASRKRVRVPHVNSRLPRGWERDKFFAEEVYKRIRELDLQDRTYREIAQVVGVADRTVDRYLHSIGRRRVIR